MLIYVIDVFVSLTIPLDQCMYPGPIQTKLQFETFFATETLGESKHAPRVKAGMDKSAQVWPTLEVVV